MKAMFPILASSLLTQAVYCSSQLAEFKAGYFFFTDKNLKDVYGTGAADFQLSYSYMFAKYFGIYGSVEYIQQDGNSTPCHNHTEFYSVPLSLGVKIAAPIASRFDLYAMLGPRYFLTRVKNYSYFVDRNSNQHGLGAFGTLGLLWHLSNRLTFDLFGEYSYKRLKFHSSKPGVEGRSVQVGGATAGAGIGYQF